MSEPALRRCGELDAHLRRHAPVLLSLTPDAGLDVLAQLRAGSLDLDLPGDAAPVCFAAKPTLEHALRARSRIHGARELSAAIRAGALTPWHLRQAVMMLTGQRLLPFRVGAHHLAPDADGVAILFPPTDCAHVLALLAKQAIMAHGDYMTHEYIVLIYKDAAGVLHHTNPQSIGNSDTVTGSFALPEGALVVGWIHDHPEKFGVDEREPSAITQTDGSHGDWYYVQQLIKSPYVDPAVVTYILDNHSGSVYEYGIGQMGDTIHPGDIIG